MGTPNPAALTAFVSPARTLLHDTSFCSAISHDPAEAAAVAAGERGGSCSAWVEERRWLMGATCQGWLPCLDLDDISSPRWEVAMASGCHV